MPLNLNNNEVTGVDLNNTEVSEVRLNGQTVFSAGGAIVDDFETGNLNNWTGGGFEVNSSDPFQGTFRAEKTTGSNGATLFTTNPPGGNVPTFGTDFEWYTQVLGSSNVHLAFETTDGGSEFGTGYAIVLQDNRGDNVLTVRQQDANGNFITQDSQSLSPSISRGVWYRIRAEFSGGVGTYTAFNTDTNTVEATVTQGENTQASGSGVLLGARGDTGLGAYDNIVLL